MEMTSELHDVVNKIDEVKEKLTDKEYKDLLELSQKYYDKCKVEEEKAKKKFVRCVVIKSTINFYIQNEEDETIHEEIYCMYTAPCGKGDCECDMCGEVPPLKRLYAEAKQSVETKLFEMKSRDDVDGYYIDSDKCIMTDHALERLKENKYMTHHSHGKRICFVFIEEFEC